MLTSRTLNWQRSGEVRSIAGRRIFVREQGGSGPPVVLLHGYPSSSYDWRFMFELLPALRLIAFDFLGFGLSEKPRDQVYSLLGQADLVGELARVGEPVVIVAHDMGISVVTELLARDLEGRLPFEIASVLLFNGSLVLEAASLTISQKVLRSPLGPIAARLSNERAFRLQFARIFSEVHPLTREEAADQWSLLAWGDGHRIVDRLIFYLGERVRLAERWHGAVRDWPGRLSLAWAGRDPICTEAVLQAVLALRPSAPLVRMPELGHYPQIEDPRRVAGIVEEFVAGV
jgi:pimeloyl-ACP methyl ester carboxylesterase